jgi:hypothetical protein
MNNNKKKEVTRTRMTSLLILVPHGGSILSRILTTGVLNVLGTEMYAG